MIKNLTIKKWNSLSKAQKSKIFLRSQQDIISTYKKVIPIIETVREKGDSALVAYNKKFDKLDLPASKLRVTDKEFAEAEAQLPKKLRKAIEFSYRNVLNYHSLSIAKEKSPFTEITHGVFIGKKSTPVDSVGMYIPNGKGTFPSMVYMLAVPAMLAEVPRKVMVSPTKNGKIDPACLYAAKLCKIDEVYKIGGAHAIAALTFGTKTVAPVAKIIGPGSTFVSAAKRYVSSYVDVGLPAGPSESLIIADGTTSAELAAYDLCIEAEHGPDSMALLLTHKQEYAEQVIQHLNKILKNAPEPQQQILTEVFKKYNSVILTESEEQSITISNQIAPEHLLIHSIYPSSMLPHLNNAGEILLGHHAPFSLANYATGANAVLPTGGMAKSYSAVNISDFIKTSSLIKITQKGFDELSPHVATLAQYEGFYFHEKALAIRKK